MFMSYVLICGDNQFYIGSTDNLQERTKRHKTGQVEATKNRLPVELIFFEGYRNKYDAIRREDYSKSTKGKRTLRNMLKEFLAKRRQIVK